jgi:DNA-binding response OmpR family regulator
MTPNPFLMRKLVFVVEDNPVQQKMLQVHFEQMLGNYTVRTFSEPESMFAELKNKPFAIVLDHFFGEKTSKTGLYYLQELKKKHSSIPVIYYTTLKDEKVKKEVLDLGALHYIIKDSASLVRLRTALDEVHAKSEKKKSFLQKIFRK